MKLTAVPSVTAEPPDIVRIGSEEARSVPLTRILKGPFKDTGNDHLPDLPNQSRSSSTRQPNFPVSPPANVLPILIPATYGGCGGSVAVATTQYFVSASSTVPGGAVNLMTRSWLSRLGGFVRVATTV